ncbi:hypothetical protein HYV80_06895 [Candidatus Woesearchaeota archaeon]|nr:hypothetical protein [Candidatus Woesearchaeota archaeon]
MDYSKADSIHHKTGNFQILSWSERNDIDNLDMHVDLTLVLHVIKDSENRGNLSFIFNTGEFTSSNKAKFTKNLIVSLSCEGCNETMPVYTTALGIGDYRIDIPREKLKWDSFHEYGISHLKISYVIKNYISKEYALGFIPIGPDKTVVIGSGCTGSNFCPPSRNLYKDVILPENALLKGYTDSGETLHTSAKINRIGVFWNDFTIPNNKNGYKEIIVQYIDLNQEKNSFFLTLITSAFIGAVIGAIISIILEKNYKKMINSLKRKRK